MGLRDKYAYAVQTAKDVRMQGSADEREGKLYFHGTTNTQAGANKIWDAIKTIPEWPNEIVADEERATLQLPEPQRMSSRSPRLVDALLSHAKGSLP